MNAWIAVLPDVIADAPVYQREQAARDFAQRASEETAGNVACVIMPLSVAVAASDLLEAALAAEAVFASQKWLPESNDPEAVALRKLRAAIAKARGES